MVKSWLEIINDDFLLPSGYCNQLHSSWSSVPASSLTLFFFSLLISASVCVKCPRPVLSASWCNIILWFVICLDVSQSTDNHFWLLSPGRHPIFWILCACVLWVCVCVLVPVSLFSGGFTTDSFFPHSFISILSYTCNMFFYKCMCVDVCVVLSTPPPISPLVWRLFCVLVLTQDVVGIFCIDVLKYGGNIQAV